MRAHPLVVAASATMMVALLAASSGDALAEDAGAPSLPACVLVTTDARYVPYGYNHVVILKNGCSKAATCSVATDVNPQTTSVEVASQTTVEVLTFTASPAQTFSARVTCKLH
jgi:hypothetical protein